MNERGIEDKFDEYIQWYPECLVEEDLLLKVCGKWVTWLEEIPRREEKVLREFQLTLSKSERNCFNYGIKKGSPLIPMTIDMDCIISKEEQPKVMKLMEQPTHVYLP